MKKYSLTRRSFIKKSSAGLAGAALTAGLSGSLYGNIVKKADTLAILGGKPVRENTYTPATWPIYDDTDEKALIDVLKGRRWSEYSKTPSEITVQFEEKWAKANNVPYAFMTNAGTNALFTSLQALDVGPGDEVITTTSTFIATINVIFDSHALPVMVNIDPETGLIDPDLVEEAITEDTKAIIPVHLGGFPCDIVKIMSIANKYNIPVVEDACQSHLAEVDGKKVGTFGATGCFSHQAGKPLICGEGGSIVGSDEELMRRCGAFINNGRDPQRKLRGSPYPGSNYRASAFQAAVLLSQFEHFVKQHETRTRNGMYIEGKLTEIPGIKKAKTYSKNTKITHISLRLDYNKEYFKNVPASKFAEAVRAEGFPIISGGPVRPPYGEGMHKTAMVEEHLNSRAFQSSFSKARLRKYRESLQSLVVNKIEKERLTLRGKTGFLGTKNDMDDIIEAVVKVANNVDQLT